MAYLLSSKEAAPAAKEFLCRQLAVIGYFGVHLAWRAYVILAWRARRRRRRAR